MAELDDLFGGNLDSKMDFLNDKKTTNSDGIYRVDLTKVKDKKKGYRSVIRFLPNLTKEGKVGQMAIEKITHYVDIKNQKELSGWFDSPKNFNEKCPLTDLYYTMQNSKNAILQERSKALKYSKKYFSYVLVIEDEQQPECVGKIMIFQYGKTIKDKIQAEKNGEITGIPCNIFDLAQGKDFVMLVKEISTGDETYPDYKNSMFRPEVSSLPIYDSEKSVFKNVPVSDGRVDSRAQQIVKDFLMKRDFELEDFSPKKLTDEQQSKITEITNFLTGKASTSFNNAAKPSSDDFELDSIVSSGSNEVSTDEDDFFSNFS
jgi:hypothetical protein